MPDNPHAEGVYVFKGGELVVPAEIPPALEINSEGINPEGINPLLGIPPDLAAPVFKTGEYVEIKAPDGAAPIPCYILDEAASVPLAWRTVPIRQILPDMFLGSAGGTLVAGRLFRAYHVVQWRRESRYCGSCGSLNGDAPLELARQCPVCGRVEYPRISPAIIVIVINDREQALLAHNHKFAGGVYSLIAGFTEAGEDLEATVAREVREEVGIELEDIRYMASQPWPFPNSLMLGFTARYVGGELKPDGKEILDARWFNRDDLPALPGHGSVSRYLINLWLEKKLPQGSLKK
jgi:NAD+ diphosphatase